MNRLLCLRQLPIAGLKLNVRGLSIDSRTTNVGNLFFALQGSNCNGHQFILEALNCGAVGAVIDNALFADVSSKTILVESVLNELKNAGLFVKHLVNPRYTIGITGSMGKTTTKVWLNDVLNYRHKSFATSGNHNTIYGLPISLFDLKDDTEYCIVELGTNKPGEISEISTYVSPDVGIITNIGEAHIGNFGSKLALAKEKISIVDGINEGGVIVFDGDSEFVDLIREAANDKKLRTISVGSSESCNIKIRPNASPNVITNQGEFNLKLSSPGAHYEYIAGCIVGVLLALDLPIMDFVPKFTDLMPLTGRGTVKAFCYDKKYLKIIDESYNANPSAMLRMIEIFENNFDSPKAAIIGQMKELGEFEYDYHHMVAEKLTQCDVEQIFFIGPKYLWSIFQTPNVKCYEELNLNTANEILMTITDNATVLLKGSNGIGLGNIIDLLLPL
jgi:UDP-N-acetylmuramoyl-tripeptide--D-alanyl-D-alanine ligase